MIRKATINDLDNIENIYNKVLDQEEEGKASIGWTRGVYPTRQTAKDALKRDDIFVYEEDGKLHATAIINTHQLDIYAKEQGCKDLRMDTQAKNQAARNLYQHLGYEEVSIVPCPEFNGIKGIELVLLEKEI